MHLAVSHGEEVLDAESAPGGEFYDGDAGWHVLVLRRPVGDDVVRRGPGEVTQIVDLHALLVQQPERLNKEK